MSLKWLIVILVVVGGVTVHSCDRYTHRLHEFVPLDVRLESGVVVNVSASGFWTKNADGSETSGGKFSFSVRVYGTHGRVALASFVVRDQEIETTVSSWQPPVRDPSDSALLFFDRVGVPLSHSSKQLEGELRVDSGDSVVVYRFTGDLEYRYREERRSRFLDRLGSV